MSGGWEGSRLRGPRWEPWEDIWKGFPDTAEGLQTVAGSRLSPAPALRGLPPVPTAPCCLSLHPVGWRMPAFSKTFSFWPRMAHAPSLLSLIWGFLRGICTENSLFFLKCPSLLNYVMYFLIFSRLSRQSTSASLTIFSRTIFHLLKILSPVSQHNSAFILYKNSICLFKGNLVWRRGEPLCLGSHPKIEIFA